MSALSGVAVASDGSALETGITADSLAPLLRDDAAGLQARGGIATRAVPLNADEDLATRLCALPAAVIFLTHTDPARSRAAARAVREAGGPIVVTEADTTMIALTAALLTTIGRAGHTPASARVVLAGSAAMPDLCPLLIAVGVGDITSWNAADAAVFPLHGLARHADAVIDLLGAEHGRAPAVLSPEPGYRLLAAPGLLAALARYPAAVLDFDVLRACALSLAAATGRDQLVPDLDDPDLAGEISSGVLRALAHRTTS